MCVYVYIYTYSYFNMFTSTILAQTHIWAALTGSRQWRWRRRITRRFLGFGKGSTGLSVVPRKTMGKTRDLELSSSDLWYLKRKSLGWLLGLWGGRTIVNFCAKNILDYWRSGKQTRHCKISRCKIPSYKPPVVGNVPASHCLTTECRWNITSLDML